MTNQWVNEPQQARSKETMNRFVVAAERLLREKPFDEITIGELVGVAERTVGSFYARFDDKWALLRTVMHRYLGSIRDFLDDLLEAEEWRDHSVHEMIRVFSHASVGLYQAHGHIFRAGLAFAATDESARKEYVGHQIHVRQKMKEALLSHPDVERTPRLDHQVELALEASEAILDTRLLYSCDWHTGEPDWDGVARDVEALFLRAGGLG